MLGRLVPATAALLLLLAAPLAFAKDAKQKQPGADATGKIYEWKAKNGVAYQYFIPKSYDPENGATLTFVLHGSNLDRRWGFLNHKAGEFRPDDIVVCPDGTTSNGKGGFNNLQSGKDVKLFRQLHEELIEQLNVKATYLYGHSQGSFFSFLYAGEAPDLVNGVVGHASGVWIGTRATKRNHHQAVVLMHGTADPVVPYAQSVGGLKVYRDAKYPNVRLRSLEGWNHWPAEHNGSVGNVFVPHTSQQLAWVEGTTSADPARVATCFGFLADAKKTRDWNDYAGLYSLAGRVAGMEGMDPASKERAGKVRAAIESLAGEHVKAIRKGLGDGDGKSMGKQPWFIHLVVFLREFDGVPDCGKLRAEWEKTLAAHKDDAIKNLKKYYAKRTKDPAAAVGFAVAALRDGFLWFECTNWDFIRGLEADRKKARKLKKKGLAKEYDALLGQMKKGLENGVKDFMKVNRGYSAP